LSSCEKAKSHRVQPLDKNFNVMPRPAHGFGGDGRRIIVVPFVVNAFTKRNELVFQPFWY